MIAIAIVESATSGLMMPSIPGNFIVGILSVVDMILALTTLLFSLGVVCDIIIEFNTLQS